MYKQHLKDTNALALVTAIEKDDLNSAVDLLLRGADANATAADGTTVLFLAIKKESVDLVKTLIVFGADVTVVGKDKHTSRHVAGHITEKDTCEAIVYYLSRVGVHRCPEGTNDCTNWCRFGEPDHWNSITQIPVVPFTTLVPSNNPSTGVKILCLDGGGIRGLIETEVLMALNAEIKKIDKNKSLTTCFDWIGGTSVGGILTAGLVYKNKTPKELRSMLFELKDKVFSGWGGPLLHGEANAEALEGILQDLLGKETKMDAVKVPKVVITSVVGDEIPPPLCCFTNYDTANVEDENVESSVTNKELPLNDPAEQDVWKVARATSAAPGYFKMAFDLYLDGGLAANNPTNAVLDAYRKSQKNNKIHGTIKTVVSVGTGFTKSKNVPPMDVYAHLTKLASLLHNVVDLAKSIASLDTERDDLAIERAKTMCAGAEAAYYRLEPSLTTNVGLAETKDDSIIHMLYETHCYIRDNATELKQLAKVLVN